MAKYVDTQVLNVLNSIMVTTTQTLKINQLSPIICAWPINW